MNAGVPQSIAKVSAMLALAVGLGTSSVADALAPPTDIDLKAAYCIKVNQLILLSLSGPEEKPALVVQTTAAAHDNLNRLQSYLLPRMQYLDALGLVAATRRADADGIQLKNLTNRCVDQMTQECKTASIPDAPRHCLEEYQLCSKGDLTDRWLSCSSLSWLPF